MVVSSRYHLLRARMLFGRCYDSEVGTASRRAPLEPNPAAPIETANWATRYWSDEVVNHAAATDMAGAALNGRRTAGYASEASEGGVT